MRTQAKGQNTRIAEARQLFQKVLDGDIRARADVMETMTRSDFPLLLGAAFGRELLQEYNSIPAVWQQYARRATVPDFKPKKLVELLGGRAGLNKVSEGEEYQARGLTEAEYSFQVEKYGDRISLMWEMLINDELDAFRDLPTRLGVAARETEEITTTGALLAADSSGVNLDFFNAGNGNAPTALALTTENLEAALRVIATRKDPEGRPIVLKGARLVVPTALEMTARRILEAIEVRRTVDTVTTIEPNYLRGVVTPVVNPWLDVLNVGAKAATTWFILPDPTASRPGVVTGFLRGHENPELRTKADTGNRVGGGSITPEEGSFEDDTIQYRVRHVIGSSLVIPTETYVSNGS